MRIAVLIVLLAAWSVGAAELTPVERGKKALLEASYSPLAWRQHAFENVWQRWEGVDARPADYAQALRDRYGLHTAPYPNDGLPMGLRKASFLFVRGVSVDCMLCHGGSILGVSYVGLGNSSLEIQALFEEMAGADGRPAKTPFTFGNVRGTSEAGGMAVYLLGYRNADLSLHRPRRELGLHDDLCEDVPPWWHLKKKKTMYYTGGVDSHSVRSKMQFMMSPLTTREEFDKHEPAFRDIEEYLRSIEPPKYPFAIDQALALRGKELFTANCASCHGVYGDKSSYPNKIVPIDDIGTDRTRYEGITEAFADYYNQTWFAKESPDGYSTRASKGYQAPPLDGIWATAPYLHNGSAPTVYHVLNTKARPAIYTRSFKTDKEDYDPIKLGWKFEELTKPPAGSLTPIERRKIYDTRQSGRGNGGHTYGDHFSDDERMAVIEYLKTL